MFPTLGGSCTHLCLKFAIAPVFLNVWLSKEAQGGVLSLAHLHKAKREAQEDTPNKEKSIFIITSWFYRKQGNINFYNFGTIIIFMANVWQHPVGFKSNEYRVKNPPHVQWVIREKFANNMWVCSFKSLKFWISSYC